MLNAKLVVVGGEVKATEIKLRLPCVIGRGKGSTVTLPHPLVSRQHCELFESNGRLWVRDLGSLNGTYVNNEKVTESELPPNELLTVGAVTFRAVYEPAQSTEDTATAGGAATHYASADPSNRTLTEEAPRVSDELTEAVDPEVVDVVNDLEAIDDDLSAMPSTPLFPAGEAIGEEGGSTIPVPSSLHGPSTPAAPLLPQPISPQPILPQPSASTPAATPSDGTGESHDGDDELDAEAVGDDEDLRDFLRSLGK
jgi:predicted component of type VI protein secretion system